MRLVYISQHNRCRSILAEAITREASEEALEVASAGLEPDLQIHPATYRYLKKRDIVTTVFTITAVKELEQSESDVAVVLTEEMAEALPFVSIVHWPMPDVSAHGGTESEMDERFDSVMNVIEQRIRRFLNHDVDQISREDLVTLLQELARDVPYEDN